jgi:antirestriction protein ArdC
VAELGAAFLCADLGLTLEPRPDHASYIGSWLEVLRRDRKAIFAAAAHAQRACEYLQLCSRGTRGPRPDAAGGAARLRAAPSGVPGF